MREDKLSRLREGLEALRARYGAAYLDSDPLQFVHRYARPDDQEVVGLVASGLAYGGVAAIRGSVEKVLAALGPHPAQLAKDLAAGRRRLEPAGLYHRWSTGRDITCLVFFSGQMIALSGSIGRFFAETHDRAGGLALSLARFSQRALALDHGGRYPGRNLPPGAGVRYFFPSPAAGSACKRLNLYLRWMVRSEEGLDLGLWDFLSPSELVVPLDTHISRIGRHLGWTRRRTPGWKMAIEITRRLARVDPADPIRYDFALSRMGILERCPRHPRSADCDLCALRRSLRRKEAA